MKEQDFLEIIKNNIGDRYIGDDCAYLKDLGIVVTQDNLVEGIHFKRNWYTPKQLGYKAMAVNISDILASGAIPTYVTIALSLPKDTSNDFIDSFYKGAKEALHGACIIGGDITGSDKIYISITAIGKTAGRKISSRSHAKVGYKIVTRGNLGDSALGLQELLNNGHNKKLIMSHIEPKLDVEFSEYISQNIETDYAMMDTSDGLADALFKIAESSNLSINSKYIEGMFGAEDFKLVAAIPADFHLPFDNIKIIGNIIEKKDYVLKIGKKIYKKYDELALYNHFHRS